MILNAKLALCQQQSKRWHRVLPLVAVASLASLVVSCATSVNIATEGSSVAPIGAMLLAQSAPENATASIAKPGWVASKFAIATANPLATDAGYQMLRAGGSAVDAAIAAQMVLTLVEPQSSGLGGGAFLMHFDGKSVQAFDGRETAPMGATSQLFLGPNGQPISFGQAVVGGRAVGVPGVLRMLEMAHQQHGRLPWAQLFEPAIALADSGFAVGARLHRLLQSDAYLRLDAQANAYFYQPDGKPHPVGYLLHNPALSTVFKRIASEGINAFYHGDVAQAMVQKVRQHATNPGSLALSDLANYQAKLRPPVCHGYRASAKDAPPSVTVCGMGPPSSGGIAVGQILGLLAHTPAASLPLRDGLPSAQWLHLYTEASRLAFADRSLYVADPDFVAPPAGDWMSLLHPAYLAQRASLISHGPSAQSLKVAEPGQPGGFKTGYAPMPEQIEYGTSHLSVVDAQGHAVAMTSSIESAFGARQMVHGFLLNNELTDFSFAPADAHGRPVANRVQPGKRPMSSMSPTLVFDQSTGALLMTLGGAGGPFIIRQASVTVYAPLNWGLNLQETANLPNFSSLNGPTLLEKGRFPTATVDLLKTMGHTVMELDLPSGIQAIGRQMDGQNDSAKRWHGAADPRREGTMRGD